MSRQQPTFGFFSILLCGLTLSPAGWVVFGDDPAPVRVDPPIIELRGPVTTHSILVHGSQAPDPPGHPAQEFDLTGAAKFRSVHPGIVSVSPRGVVSGVADGEGEVEVKVAGATLRVAVIVKDSQSPRTFHFDNDITPVLTRFGCNASGCHGKAEGQNGFKLSVFGFDAAGDYDALAKEARGRRVSVGAPDGSLLLLKATNRLAHGGGQRMTPDSWAYQTLKDWMLAGLPIGDPNAPRVEAVAITPAERSLRIGATQQLRVIATYSDRRQVDVTALAKYQSNNDGIASVDEYGLVTVGKVPGQVAIMASFMGAVNIFQALIPRAEKIDTYPELEENSFIDRLVYDKLRKLNVLPSDQASDADFLRRTHIDIIGTLPTAGEARAFLTSTEPNRRARLVDELLKRPEYATYWALKWSDLLRVDRDILGHQSAYAYYRWIRESFARNKPIDRFVYEILTAEGPLNEAPQGGLFKVVEKPGERASTVSQVFLGIRIECAECHHHPFDRWSQSDYYGMADFFNQVKTSKSARGEILLAEGSAETKHPRTGKVIYAHPLGSKVPASSPPGDRRLVLADWLTAPSNPWFARNVVNRLWAHFMGRGLVEPVDDVRATNPPSNPELLDALTQHFVKSGFDMQATIRTLTSSQVYQLSSKPNVTNERDEQNYSRALLKSLDAEVLLDALCQVTDIPEKFNGVASGYRAIELWDSQVLHDFLGLFGRPIRKSACECERASDPNVAQVLHLMNSPRVNNKLSHDAGSIARLVREHDATSELVEALYLNFYSRFPSSQEAEIVAAYLDSAARLVSEASSEEVTSARREAAADIAWSLLNSLEFTRNH